MNKHYIYNIERLADLQGVLFRLIELSDNEKEREFYEQLLEKIKNKIKEQTKWYSFLMQKEI